MSRRSRLYSCAVRRALAFLRGLTDPRDRAFWAGASLHGMALEYLHEPDAPRGRAVPVRLFRVSPPGTLARENHRRRRSGLPLLRGIFR